MLKQSGNTVDEGVFFWLKYKQEDGHKHCVWSLKYKGWHESSSTVFKKQRFVKVQRVECHRYALSTTVFNLKVYLLHPDFITNSSCEGDKQHLCVIPRELGPVIRLHFQSVLTKNKKKNYNIFTAKQLCAAVHHCQKQLFSYQYTNVAISFQTIQTYKL